MSETIDIDTSKKAPTFTVESDKELTDLVFLLASKQLLLTTAKASLQASIEAAKKAYDDETRDISAEIEAGFAAVEKYAQDHRDRLFPVKGKKRSKTLTLLAHKLQYRSSEAVEAPTNAVAIIREAIATVEAYDSPDGNWNNVPCSAVAAKLQTLLRTPPQEFDKEAFTALVKNPEPPCKELAEWLNLHGLRVSETESFKLTFNFTPTKEDEA